VVGLGRFVRECLLRSSRATGFGLGICQQRGAPGRSLDSVLRSQKFTRPLREKSPPTAVQYQVVLSRGIRGLIGSISPKYWTLRSQNR
jgi:hypothetical protein